MTDLPVKIKQAEEMILNELQLLSEETKEGDELEAVAGALHAVFKFAFQKAPLDILAVNLITNVLSSTISEQTFSTLENLHGN
jgi:hypothetical protein